MLKKIMAILAISVMTSMPIYSDIHDEEKGLTGTANQNFEIYSGIENWFKEIETSNLKSGCAALTTLSLLVLYEIYTYKNLTSGFEAE